MRLADRVGALHAQAERMRQVGAHPVAARVAALEVRCEQLFLALVLLADQRFETWHVQVEQGAERADCT
jgi:hypothetical protein